MKRFKLFGLYLSIFVLLFYTAFIPAATIHAEVQHEGTNVERATVQTLDEDEQIPLTEDENPSSKILTYLANNDTVILLEQLADVSYVEFEDDTLGIVQGYIDNQFLHINVEEDSMVSSEDTNGTLDDKEESTEETDGTLENDNVVDEEDADAEIESEDTDNSSTDLDEVTDEPEEESTSEQVEQESEVQPTIATFSAAQKSLKGIALKSPTNVYQKQDKNSKVLKSYALGSVLQYKTFTTEWYEATVYLNGKAHTGYIHKNDVENSTSQQRDLIGIGLNNSTHVYKSTSTSSGILKSYAMGSILRYKTFTNNWYEATVIVNGKKHTGYIHKSHVENAVEKQKDLRGIGLKSPTHVYKSASTSSGAHKSYAKGTLLKYKTFTTNWYEATVYVNGKKHTGYIHKSHVENAIEQQKDLRGIGLNSSTHVYKSTSTSSGVLKSYKKGTILKFKTFSNAWYEATVFVNGKQHTGYIAKKDVEEIYQTQKSVEGMALKAKTNVYSIPSTGASVLKSYAKGSLIKFKTFSPNWYEASVIVNGQRKSGYFHKNDVSTDTVAYTQTKYDITLEKALDLQIKAQPKTYATAYVHKNALENKNGKWVVTGTGWNVRSGPSTAHSVVGKLDERYTKDAITVYQTEGDFYKFSTWIIALEKDTLPYLDPSNVNKNSTEYFQFLKLSSSAGLHVAEVNQKILYDKGIFKGKASSFIQAAKDHNINEIYLISHAMLETGNGTSDLAKGGTYNGKKVYNMYGIGAADSCNSPYQCGLKFAYDQDWTTPEKAIVGGAKFIADRYINKGQDTLYKMKWNPEAMVKSGVATHQYATDIAWAEKQTYNIKKYYDLLDNYSLIFDVPVYK